MSPASSLELYGSLCFLVEQCPARKCVETGGKEQGATQSCVFAKAIAITAGLRIHVSLKGFEKVTGEALLQPTYWTCMDTAMNICWEVGTFLYSSAGGFMWDKREND